MESSRKSDKEIILEVLKPSGSKLNAKHPSTAAKTLGIDVSLVRNVHVLPIISFNCLLLYMF